MRILTIVLCVSPLLACNRIEDITASGGSTAEVRSGARFSISLGTSPTVSPEYRYDWETPQVTGSAVAYEGLGESRDRDRMPGSSGEAVFVFKAVQAGEADILVKVRAGPKAEPHADYKVHVRVR